jgi:hypothetical protein
MTHLKFPWLGLQTKQMYNNYNYNIVNLEQKNSFYTVLAHQLVHFLEAVYVSLPSTRFWSCFSNF